MGAVWQRRLRVDLTSGRYREEPIGQEEFRQFLGGRGLNVRLLMEEVPAGLDGLSPENPLIFGIGPLNGTPFPGGSRFNVTAVSPQTGILGDSNAGGFLGAELKFCGYDQVVIRGQAPHPVYLLLTEEGAEVRPAKHIWGLDVWATDAAIKAELGDQRVQVAAVGPAAENGVRFAGIFANLVRAAARTGMGTVMASKRLKAVAVRGKLPIKPSNGEEFGRLLQEIDAEIYRHGEYRVRSLLGTTKLVHALNEAGCLATRHFLSGRFQGAEAVSGETLAERWKTKSKACFACTIPCSRFFRVSSGKYAGLASEGPEFEGLAGFSSRIGNASLEAALKGVDMCNRLGMDVITASECVAFAMECYQRGILSPRDLDGLDLSWGNMESTFRLLHKIAYREGAGELFYGGVLKAARAIGGQAEDLAMHVKGLEIFQADPRGLKGYALGNAVASRGGDHLRSEPSFEFTEDAEEAVRRFGVPEAAFRLEYKGKGKVVKVYEERAALADCLNACKNTLVNMEILPYEQAARVLTALFGWSWDAEEIRLACERVVNLERAFIAREGIRRQDDMLPRRFLTEPLPSECGPSAGSVVELEPMLDEYYRERGWDVATGLPTVGKLRQLDLHWVVDRLVRAAVPITG